MLESYMELLLRNILTQAPALLIICATIYLCVRSLANAIPRCFGCDSDEEEPVTPLETVADIVSTIVESLHLDGEEKVKLVCKLFDKISIEVLEDSSQSDIPEDIDQILKEAQGNE